MSPSFPAAIAGPFSLFSSRLSDGPASPPLPNATCAFLRSRYVLLSLPLSRVFPRRNEPPQSSQPFAPATLSERRRPPNTIPAESFCNPLRSQPHDGLPSAAQIDF